MGPSFACNTLADLEIKQKSIISAAKIKSILIYVWRVIVASEKFRLYVVFKAHSDYGICLVKILVMHVYGWGYISCHDCEKDFF